MKALAVSQQASRDPSQSPVSSTGRIDLACDQFEKACQAGTLPMIEEVLLQVPPEERDRLLAELLEIELDFRQRGGTFLQLEEYRGRFPESADLVEGVFRRVVKTRRLGDYELLEELGRGGMGVVYKARQVYLNQTVALKVLPHRYLDDSQAVSRFRREMQSIGGLDHPNIVRAFNAGEAGGVQFLVMEFVDGINLQQFVGMGRRPSASSCPGPLGVGAACEIIRQAALGLQHAYEHQLVHRDIKPANLMLCGVPGTPGHGQVKLLDLGLAKFHAERRGDAQPQHALTQPGVTMGTIDYMAPEQWENSAAADIRADIYSLGCTLYFLLSGKVPYGDPPYDTSRKKLMAHVVAPIPSLVEVCPDCPRDLEEVYETMLAKDPRERYATPAEVAEAVAEFADEEELAELIAALANDSWIAARRLDLRSPEADTARKQGAGSVGSHARRRTTSRRIARQRFRRNIQWAVLASLLAVIFGLVAWVAMRPAGDRSGSGERAVESGEGSGKGPGSRTSAAAPPVARGAVAADLALLPGLNGPWWFEETPWLTPFLRQAIADKVLSSPDPAAVLGEHPRRYLDPNTAEAESWLRELAGRCHGDLTPAQLQLIDRLKTFSDGNRDDDAQPSRTLDEALQQFTTGHGNGAWPAADLHTKALLQHRMAALDNNHALALQAKKSYVAALDAYSAEKKTPASARLLCLADYAALCADALGDTKEAKQRLDEVLAAGDLPVLFHVSTLVARGDIAAASATNSGDYEDLRFSAAQGLLAGAKAVKPSHPLAATRRRAACLEPDGPMEGRGGPHAVPGCLQYSLDQQQGRPPRGGLRLP